MKHVQSVVVFVLRYIDRFFQKKNYKDQCKESESRIISKYTYIYIFLNFSSQMKQLLTANLRSKQDFPTPLSPIRTNLNR